VAVFRRFQLSVVRSAASPRRSGPARRRCRPLSPRGTRTDDDYATRVAQLLGSTGVPPLDAMTLASNGGSNALAGGVSGVPFFGKFALDQTDWDSLMETFRDL
jgi:hypothetical protein